MNKKNDRTLLHDKVKKNYKGEKYYEKPRLIAVKLLANQVLSGNCLDASGGCSGNATAQ